MFDRSPVGAKRGKYPPVAARSRCGRRTAADSSTEPAIASWLLRSPNGGHPRERRSCRWRSLACSSKGITARRFPVSLQRTTTSTRTAAGSSWSGPRPGTATSCSSANGSRKCAHAWRRRAAGSAAPMLSFRMSNASSEDRNRTNPVHIAGGGLAGSEAAWQLAERGYRVVLHEMRPVRATPAHQTDRLAELVCTNTFKSTETSNAHGLLKAEMRALGSLILRAADEARVPGGSALAVDRDVFSAAVHRWVTAHPSIEVVRDEMTELPSPGIIATGPLTSDALSTAIQARLGVESLAFYDAIAPIVAGESVDANVVFRASRYGKETMAGAAASRSE